MSLLERLGSKRHEQHAAVEYQLVEFLQKDCEIDPLVVEQLRLGEERRLKALFSAPLGSFDDAFLQVALDGKEGSFESLPRRTFSTASVHLITEFILRNEDFYPARTMEWLVVSRKTSCWASPGLVQRIISSGDSRLLLLVLVYVPDVREEDYVELLKHVLSQRSSLSMSDLPSLQGLDQYTSLMATLFSMPFATLRMRSFLRLTAEELACTLDAILAVFPAAPERARALSVKVLVRMASAADLAHWLGALVDSHAVLVAMHPALVSRIFMLRGLVRERLEVYTECERLMPQLHNLDLVKRQSREASSSVLDRSCASYRVEMESL